MKIILMLLALAPLWASAVSPDLTKLAEQKRVELTKKEARVARIGHISAGRQVSGGILGTYPGFGLGHVVQNRWEDDGKFFTYSQLGSFALMAASGSCVGKVFDTDDNDCSGPQEVLLLTGLVSYVGLRIWEIVDVWRAPARQNRRYEHVRERLEKMPDPVTSQWQFVPVVREMKLAGLGMQLQF